MTLLRRGYEKAVNSILGILAWIPCLEEASYHVPEQSYKETFMAWD